MDKTVNSRSQFSTQIPNHAAHPPLLDCFFLLLTKTGERLCSFSLFLFSAGPNVLPAGGHFKGQRMR